MLLEKPENVFDLQPAPAALLVDMEGTLTEFSPSGSSVIEAVVHFEEAATRSGFDLCRVHYITNASLKELDAQWPVISGRIHINAHKPFFVPPRGFEQYGYATVVVGDQYLTDGLLAWRFGFSFGLVRSAQPPPTWPRLQLSVGRALSAAFFKRVEQDR